MKYILCILLSCCGFAQQFPAASVTTPTWQKYTVTKITNGTSGCANANGCWQVNTSTPVNATAALTQNLVVFVLPLGGRITDAHIKSAVACTGAATTSVTLGTTGSATYYLSGAYDLKAAVSATNITTAALANRGSDTTASTNVVATITDTTNNVDQIVAGCSFIVYLIASVLP